MEALAVLLTFAVIIIAALVVVIRVKKYNS